MQDCRAAAAAGDEPPALCATSYAALGFAAALQRPSDAPAAARELAALVAAAARGVTRDVAEAMANDCAAAGELLARLEHGEAAAAGRAVARAAVVGLSSSRAAAVAAAHRAAALAQRRVAKKREAADAEALPLHEAGPPAEALHADALALVLAALDARSLARATCVCRAWRAAAATADAELWRPLLERHFSAGRRRTTTHNSSSVFGAAPVSWARVFAAAAAAHPAFDAPRYSCPRCRTLTWLHVLEAQQDEGLGQRPSLARHRHSWRATSAEQAARLTLRKHSLASPETSSSTSDSEAQAEMETEMHSEGDAARRHRLWALPRGVGALRLT